MRSTIMDFDLENVEYEDLNDIYNEIATLLGLDAAIAIYNKFRGTQVSFPLEMLSKEFIFRQIRNDYNGYNIRELATKYGYTEKWIRKIVNEDPKCQN